MDANPSLRPRSGKCPRCRKDLSWPDGEHVAMMVWDRNIELWCAPCGDKAFPRLNSLFAIAAFRPWSRAKALKKLRELRAKYPKSPARLKRQRRSANR